MRADRPQAAALIDALKGVGHVFAGAAHDSGALRAKIEAELGAEALIQANSSGAIKPPLAPDLYAERHKVDNFFQRIIRFRRIALRCEKTLTNVMGFVFRALPTATAKP